MHILGLDNGIDSPSKTVTTDFQKGIVHSAVKCVAASAAVGCEQGEKGTAHTYIVAKRKSEKTKTGAAAPVFSCSVSDSPQDVVAYQKETYIFYIFLRQTTVVPNRKLCYNECN